MLRQAHQRRTQMSGLWLRTAGSGTLAVGMTECWPVFVLCIGTFAGAKATAECASCMKGDR